MKLTTLIPSRCLAKRRRSTISATYYVYTPRPTTVNFWLRPIQQHNSSIVVTSLSPRMSSANSDRLMQAKYTNEELDALTTTEQHALLKGSYTRYDKATCSIIYWHGDGLGCRKEGKYLQSILIRFGIKGNRWKIPNTSDAQKRLQRHLRSITDTSSQPEAFKELLIVHYGGHGDFDVGFERPNEQQCLIGVPGGNSNSVDWSTLVRQELKNCKKDVILILDCCSAALAIKNSTGCRLITLAACGRSENTPVPGPSSFTHRLGQALQRFDKPFSVHELFQAVEPLYDAQPVLDSCVPSVCHNVFFDSEMSPPYFYTRRPEGVSLDPVLDPLTKVQRCHLTEVVKRREARMFSPEIMATPSTSIGGKMRRTLDVCGSTWWLVYCFLPVCFMGLLLSTGLLDLLRP